jgi:hypothetical protein
MIKEKKKWTTVLTNRIDKEEWVFPTMAASNFSGLVVEVTGRDPETGEGVGTVLIGDSDRPIGTIKKTWQLHNFTPIDGAIEKVEVTNKSKSND